MTGCEALAGTPVAVRLDLLSPAPQREHLPPGETELRSVEPRCDTKEGVPPSEENDLFEENLVEDDHLAHTHYLRDNVQLFHFSEDEAMMTRSHTVTTTASQLH